MASGPPPPTQDKNGYWHDPGTGRFIPKPQDALGTAPSSSNPNDKVVRIKRTVDDLAKDMEIVEQDALPKIRDALPRIRTIAEYIQAQLGRSPQGPSPIPDQDERLQDDPEPLPPSNYSNRLLIRWRPPNKQLPDADMRSAWLIGAFLEEANLTRAKLHKAQLQGAHLQGAILDDAELTDADLQYADLSNTFLRRAKLQGADLRNANLTNANMECAEVNQEQLDNAKGQATIRGPINPIEPTDTPKVKAPQELMTYLRNILCDNFDLEELRILCFALKTEGERLDYDKLRGEQQETKAMSLIEYLDNRGRIPQLVTYILEKRDNIDWQDMLQRP